MTASDPNFLTPEQVVARWGGAVTVQTLANWRAAARGPAFVRVGSRVRYKLADVEAYEAAQRQNPGEVA